MRLIQVFLAFFICLSAQTNLRNEEILNHIISLSNVNSANYLKSEKTIINNWQIGFTPMILELMSMTYNRESRVKYERILHSKTGQKFGQNIDEWYHWLWNQKYIEFPLYSLFKSELYRIIDAKFKDYFDSNITSIRLDEVRWGGVKQDGIPPLKYPKMILAKDVNYLEDDHIIFGLEINGDFRAYPKRILAWHEMFIDKVGEVDIAGVYCTLCGTVIIYETGQHKLGTSGFLYRSNKLMYDKKTSSLWSTILGKPVIGKLVNKDIKLKSRPVVTSTWGEWKRRYPNTTVLSLETGYRRDYSEGAAYASYFATDRLMFTVPKLDSRLKNKDDVITLFFDSFPNKALAISKDYLDNNKLFSRKFGNRNLLFLTDKSSATRVYDIKDHQFSEWDHKASIKDQNGTKWKLNEDYLINNNGVKLRRIVANQSFWFAWFSIHPYTELIK